MHSFEQQTYLGLVIWNTCLLCMALHKYEEVILKVLLFGLLMVENCQKWQPHWISGIFLPSPVALLVERFSTIFSCRFLHLLHLNETFKNNYFFDPHVALSLIMPIISVMTTDASGRGGLKDLQCDTMIT